MGIISNIKSSVSKTYNSIDKSVGGILPGGVSRSTSTSSSTSTQNYTPMPTQQSTPQTPAYSQSGQPYFSSPSTSSSINTITKSSGGGGGSGGGNNSGVVTSAPMSTPSGPVIVNVSSGQPIASTTSQINQSLPLQSNYQSKSGNIYNPSIDIHKSGTLTLPSSPNVLNYLKENSLRNPVGTVIGTGQIIKGKTKDILDRANQKDQRTKLSQQEQQKLQFGKRETSFTQSGRGTMITSFKPYTDQEISKLATSEKISESAAINELQRRENERYGTNRQLYINSILPSLRSNAEDKLNSKFNELNDKTRRGEISPEQANKVLKSEEDKINNDLNKELNNKIQDWHNSNGVKIQKESKVYIDNLSNKIKINKALTFAPLLFAAGAATGAALGAIAASSVAGETAIGIGGSVLTGIGTAQTTGEFIQAKREGTLSASKIGSILIPQALFAAGGYSGASLTGKAISNINQNKLNAAFESANVEPSGKPRGIIKEAEFKRFDIPENAKPELTKQLSAGNRISIQEYKISTLNKDYQKIIDKNFPKLKITKIEITDQYGNFIDSKTLTKVEFQKGFKTYNDYTIGKSEGTYNPKTGLTTLETFYQSGKASARSPREILKQKDIIRSSKPVVYQDELSGINLKGIRSQGYSFEGPRRIGTKSKPLTYKDIAEVSSSELYNRFPARSYNIREVLKLTETKQARAIVSKITDQGEIPVKALSGKVKKYSLEAVSGSSENVPKPIEFETKINKQIKGFEEEIKPKPKRAIYKNQYVPPSKPINNKPTQQVISQDLLQTPSQFEGKGSYELSQYQGADITGVTKSSLKFLNTESINPVAKNLFIIPAESIIQKDINKQQNKLNANIKLSSKNIQKEIEKTPTSFKIPSSIKMNDIQTLSLNVNQAQNQPSKSNQTQIQETIQIQETVPRINYPSVPFVPIKIPEFNIPNLPKLPNSQGGGFQRVKIPKTIQRKSQPKYTASLAAAAVQSKPLEITEDQLKKLNESTYSGIESRPVISLVKNKKNNFKSSPNKKKVYFGNEDNFGAIM